MLSAPVGAPLRRRLWAAMDPRARPSGLSALNRLLVAAILLSVAIAVAETESAVSAGREALFRAAELAFGILFLVEYLARFWVAAESGGWAARWRWARSFPAVVDLLAVLPVLAVTGAGPLYLLRLLRIARLIRLAKLGRLSSAWRLMAGVLVARRAELLLSLYAALFAMLASASLLFLIEGPVQPDQFGSIPRSLWWAVVTLTTIGYGDTYPVTALGKLVAGATAVVGIGLIAAPAGILAAALGDAMARRREATAEAGGEG